MRINRTRLVILIIITLIVGVIFVMDLWGNGKKDVRVVLDDISNLDCNTKEKQIKINMDKLSFCKKDSDCTVISYQCPFGCYKGINNRVTTDQLDSQVQDYANNCPMCLYNCGKAPTESQIKCINKKCQIL